jgi:hypothetical protein
LKYKPARELEPLDWNFSSCPEQEIPYLFCYEFARECLAVLENVEFMRHGVIEPPTYWSPNPDFGWKEWPVWPYLSVPQAERQKRIAKLLLPNLAVDVIRIRTEHPEFSDWEVYKAIDSEKNSASANEPQKGRRALSARYHDQLRGLSIYRLRQYYSARVTLERLAEFYQKAAYNSSSNLDRGKRQTPKHIAAFCLLAQDRMRHGLWFPPFGPHLIKP